MVEETPGSGGARSPRPAGKQLPEKRKGFMIYLPPSLHAKLKLEAIKRAVSMSEVASTAVAQFLSDAPWREGQTPLAPPPPPEPFVGIFGREPEGPSAADTGTGTPVPPETQTAQQPAAVAPQQQTYEVE